MAQTIPVSEIARKPFRDSVKFENRFKEAGYRIVGRHSAVKVCHWTKSALKGGKACYKSWYGIESHRCIQMTPSLQPR
jgi:tRNA wybutosine-synthesizing protein 1